MNIIDIRPVQNYTVYTVLASPEQTQKASSDYPAPLSKCCYGYYIKDQKNRTIIEWFGTYKNPLEATLHGIIAAQSMARLEELYGEHTPHENART